MSLPELLKMFPFSFIEPRHITRELSSTCKCWQVQMFGRKTPTAGNFPANLLRNTLLQWLRCHHNLQSRCGHHHLFPGNSCDLSCIIVNMSMCLCAALYIHLHVPDFICHMNEIQPTELDIILTISVFLHQVPLQDTVEYKPQVSHTWVSSRRKRQH